MQTQQHKLDDAVATTARALHVFEKAYGPEHRRVAMGLSNLGIIQQQRNDYAGALESYRRSLAIFEKTSTKDHPFLSYALLGIGSSLAELKRPAEALPIIERALALRVAAAMSPDLVAEVRFVLVELLYTDPRTRARAIAEAKIALTEYEKASDAEGIAEVRTWQATHR